MSINVRYAVASSLRTRRIPHDVYKSIFEFADCTNKQLHKAALTKVLSSLPKHDCGITYLVFDNSRHFFNGMCCFKCEPGMAKGRYVTFVINFVK